METKTEELIKALEEKKHELHEKVETLDRTIKMFQNGHFLPPSKNDKIAEDDSSKEYKKNSPIKYKVLFSLNILSKGTVRDIVDEIKKHEQVKNDKKFLRSVTMVASALKGKGVIGAEKDGIKNVYFIPSRE